MKITLPFYFGATTKKDNAGFPQTFFFDFFLDKDLGIYRQRNTRSLKKILDDAYLKGAMMAGGMNDRVVGEARVNEIFDFIQDNFLLKKTSHVLEIGCGEGQVLKKIAKQGIHCVGLEPGPQVLQLKKYGIDVINDFFPSKKINDTYELILHFGVLEHMSDPVTFMLEQKRLLTKNGAIIFAVPNCEYDLAAGDISFFLHQHYNYFTKAGIEHLAKKSGLRLAKVIEPKSGGFLYAKFTLSKKSNKTKKTTASFSDKDLKKNMKHFNNVVLTFFSDTKQSDIAIYCPLRGMNVLSLAGITDCRLVDDNQSLQGKYLPTFSKKVENFASLKQNPPKKLLIYSRTFGELIKEKCQREKKLSNTEIKTVDDLLQE